jgi:hypothetical protein
MGTPPWLGQALTQEAAQPAQVTVCGQTTTEACRAASHPHRWGARPVKPRRD